jgi:hypothetical protein
MRKKPSMPPPAKAFSKIGNETESNEMPPASTAENTKEIPKK